MSKPQPIPESLVCSECGLDWSLHPDNPRRRDCIALLVKNQDVQTIPWYSTHYCYLGHINCWSHYQVTYTNVTFSESDDPDMGVPAIVS